MAKHAWIARLPRKVHLERLEPDALRGGVNVQLAELEMAAFSESPSAASVGMFRCPACGYVIYVEQRFLEELGALQTVQSVESATPRHVECDALMVLCTPERGRNESEEHL